MLPSLYVTLKDIGDIEGTEVVREKVECQVGGSDAEFKTRDDSVAIEMERSGWI